MTMVLCIKCEGRGHCDGYVCCYCDGITMVENGEYLTTCERRTPADVAAEWPEEKTQEIPRFPAGERGAA